MQRRNCHRRRHQGCPLTTIVASVLVVRLRSGSPVRPTRPSHAHDSSTRPHPFFTSAETQAIDLDDMILNTEFRLCLRVRGSGAKRTRKVHRYRHWVGRSFLGSFFHSCDIDASTIAYRPTSHVAPASSFVGLMPHASNIEGLASLHPG